MSVCVWGTVYMRLTLLQIYIDISSNSRDVLSSFVNTFLRFSWHMLLIIFQRLLHYNALYWLCKCLSMKLNGSSFPGLFCSIASHPLSRFSFVLFLFCLAYYTPFCSVSDEKLRAVQRSASLKFWVTWKYSWSLCKTDLVKTFSAFLYVDKAEIWEIVNQ